LTRYSVLDSYPALPGKCISCGGVATPVLDTGISIDYYGAVTFCLLCAKDLGRNAGLVDPTPVADSAPGITKEELNEALNVLVSGISVFSGTLNLALDAVCSVENSEAETSEPEESGEESERPAGQAGDFNFSKGSTSLSSGPSNEPGPSFNLL